MKRFIRKHPRFAVLSGVVLAGAIVAGAAALQLQRTVPELTVVDTSQASLDAAPPAAPTDIAWPEMGQAGVSVGGVGLISETPEQKPQAIASLVKVMTAYVILKNHPLNTGEPGAEVTFEEQDVANYHQRMANAESVVAVEAGAKMTQRELLRGLMLASGNNLADVLARWHAGSVEAFVAQMNAEAAALGMTSTTYVDAAGLMPASVSTAHDQILLANAAMADPTFAGIVREVQAELPGAGVVYNTNSELGSNGIVGIKTGWTEEAGACFIFAAEVPVEGETATVIGAVLGQNTLADAFARSNELIAAGSRNVSLVKLGAEGEVAGQITSKWGATADAVLTTNASALLIPGTEIQRTINLVPTDNIEEGADVGNVRYTVGGQVIEVPLKASAPVEGPDLVWRLTRLQ